MVGAIQEAEEALIIHKTNNRVSYRIKAQMMQTEKKIVKASTIVASNSKRWITIDVAPVMEITATLLNKE